MTEDDFRRIEQMMASQLARQIGVVEENLQHKLDLVVEGQQMLTERMDRMGTELRGDVQMLDERLTRVEVRLTRVEGRLTQVETKIDGVAGDLAAHRTDTEVHRRGYRVREE